MSSGKVSGQIKESNCQFFEQNLMFSERVFLLLHVVHCVLSRVIELTVTISLYAYCYHMFLYTSIPVG